MHFGLIDVHNLFEEVIENVLLNRVIAVGKLTNFRINLIPRPSDLALHKTIERRKILIQLFVTGTVFCVDDVSLL